MCNSRNVPLCSSCNVWCNASLLAIGVVLYVDGVCFEDQSWLRPVDYGSYINVAGLESVLKGISLAVSWTVKCFRVMIDSSSVFNWVKSIIGEDGNIKARGLSKVLVRRRLKLLLMNLFFNCL